MNCIHKKGHAHIPTLLGEVYTLIDILCIYGYFDVLSCISNILYIETVAIYIILYIHIFRLNTVYQKIHVYLQTSSLARISTNGKLVEFGILVWG